MVNPLMKFGKEKPANVMKSVDEFLQSLKVKKAKMVKMVVLI